MALFVKEPVLSLDSPINLDYDNQFIRSLMETKLQEVHYKNLSVVDTPTKEELAKEKEEEKQEDEDKDKSTTKGKK